MGVKKIILDIRAQLDKAVKQMKGLGGEAKKADKEVSKLDEGFKRAGQTFAALFSVAAITGFTRKIIEVRQEFEKFEAVLKVSLGSAEKANIEFAKIQKFASETPFSVRELTDAFVKLVNQGFKPTTEQMRKLGDVAASTGKSFDQLAEAIIDATTGEFERLKEFGIRASKMGDKVTFTFKEVETQVDFTATAIRNYILSLGDAIGISGAMEEISKTLGGQISNLGDSWDMLLDTIGGETQTIFTGVIGLLSTFLEKMRFAVMITDEVRRQVQLQALGEAEQANIEFFLDYLNIIQKSGLVFKSYSDAAESFLRIDRERLKHITFLKTEGSEAERVLLAARIETIEGFARAEDIAEIRRITRLLKLDEKKTQKSIKQFNTRLAREEKAFDSLLQKELDSIDKKSEEMMDAWEKETKAYDKNIGERELRDLDHARNQIRLAQEIKQIELAIASELFFATSLLMKSGSAEFKAMQIIATTIDTYAAAVAAYKSTSAIPAIGPLAAPAAAAAAIAFGLAQVQKIIGLTFEKGGFTGRANLPFVDARGKRIAGVVHENEFVFSEPKTRALRPFFEDIHNDRINIRQLSALTREGGIQNMVNANFSQETLERLVKDVLYEMKDKQTIEIPYKGGTKIKRGSVTTILK